MSIDDTLNKEFKSYYKFDIMAHTSFSLSFKTVNAISFSLI